jgi:hypothetical protein
MRGMQLFVQGAHAICVSNSGQLFSVGQNQYGQLGRGTFDIEASQHGQPWGGVEDFSHHLFWHTCAQPNKPKSATSACVD